MGINREQLVLGHDHFAALGGVGGRGEDDEARQPHGLHDDERDRHERRHALRSARAEQPEYDGERDKGHPHDRRDDANRQVVAPHDGGAVSRGQPHVHEERLQVGGQADREHDEQHGGEPASAQDGQHERDARDDGEPGRDENPPHVGDRVREVGRRPRHDLERRDDVDGEGEERRDDGAVGKPFLPRGLVRLPAEYRLALLLGLGGLALAVRRGLSGGLAVVGLGSLARSGCF